MSELYGDGNSTFESTVTDSGQSSGIGSDSYTLTAYDKNGVHDDVAASQQRRGIACVSGDALAGAFHGSDEPRDRRKVPGPAPVAGDVDGGGDESGIVAFGGRRHRRRM